MLTGAPRVVAAVLALVAEAAAAAAAAAAARTAVGGMSVVTPKKSKWDCSRARSQSDQEGVFRRCLYCTAHVPPPRGGSAAETARTAAIFELAIVEAVKARPGGNLRKQYLGLSARALLSGSGPAVEA